MHRVIPLSLPPSPFIQEKCPALRDVNAVRVLCVFSDEPSMFSSLHVHLSFKPLKLLYLFRPMP